MRERAIDVVHDLIRRARLPLDSAAVEALGAPSPGGPVAADRIGGLLLGLAIGDALGNTTESRTPEERRAVHGEIRDYRPNRHASGQPVGVPSDDTQLAFWTLEHLLEHERVVPDRLVATFAERPIFGMGRTVRGALGRLRQGAPWWEAAERSAGNGAMMRIAPVVLPHAESTSTDLWGDAILGGAVTHNDPTSIAACVALAGLVREALTMARPPAPTWWLDAYTERARPLEGETVLEPRHRHFVFRGPAWRLVDTEVRQALAQGRPTLEACEHWYSGAFLLETIPSVLYILARHADDPEEAIVRAVNDTRDNDTIGAIVGAVVGALHGRAALPVRWVSGLLGRTQADDDGRVFALVDEACARWGMREC